MIIIRKGEARVDNTFRIFKLYFSSETGKYWNGATFSGGQAIGSSSDATWNLGGVGATMSEVKNDHDGFYFEYHMGKISVEPTEEVVAIFRCHTTDNKFHALTASFSWE